MRCVRNQVQADCPDGASVQCCKALSLPLSMWENCCRIRVKHQTKAGSRILGTCQFTLLMGRLASSQMQLLVEYSLPGKDCECYITEIPVLCFPSKLNYGLMVWGHRFRKETLGFLAAHNGLDDTFLRGFCHWHSAIIIKFPLQHSILTYHRELAQ